MVCASQWLLGVVTNSNSRKRLMILAGSGRVAGKSRSIAGGSLIVPLSLEMSFGGSRAGGAVGLEMTSRGNSIVGGPVGLELSLARSGLGGAGGNKASCFLSNSIGVLADSVEWGGSVVG